MRLSELLKEKKQNTINNLSADKNAIMKASTDALIQKKLSESALKKGDKLPAFSLPNVHGNKVNSADLLGGKKLVISFYRGGWCPYCNVELKALQSNLAEFKSLGAELIAISPETADNSLTTSEKNELEFEVLSDIDNVYAKELGLVFQMPEDLRELYHSFNLNVDAHNGNKDYELPMPATYVVNEEGVVTYAFVPEDYTMRLDPEDIIEALK